MNMKNPLIAAHVPYDPASCHYITHDHCECHSMYCKNSSN